MDPIVQAIKPLLDALGVEPWMYAPIICIALLNQYAAAAFNGWGKAQGFVLAVATGLTCGVGSVYLGHLDLGAGGFRVLVMTVGALIAEGALQAAAASDNPLFKFLPKNNQLVKAKDEPA